MTSPEKAPKNSKDVKSGTSDGASSSAPGLDLVSLSQGPAAGSGETSFQTSLGQSDPPSARLDLLSCAGPLKFGDNLIQSALRAAGVEFMAHKPNETVNQWRHEGSSDAKDVLVLTSQYKVDQAAFLDANPQFKGRFPQDLDLNDEYKLRHPTTGEVDDSWKVKGIGKDGSVTLTRDYRLEVKARDNHSGLVEGLANVPDSFTDSLRRKLATLPPNVVASLQRHGYKVVAAYTIPDAMPGLAKLTPRGWREDLTFFDSDGTHDDVSKRIIAPMRMIRADGEVEPVTRENVVVHQVGHALDFAHGFLSRTPEFIKAYDEDMKNIPDHLKRDDVIKYLSQPNGVGRQETFASIFGLAFKMPENEHQTEFLTRHFPRVRQVVDKQIKELR